MREPHTYECLKIKTISLRTDDSMREAIIFDNPPSKPCDSESSNDIKLATERGTQTKEMV